MITRTILTIGLLAMSPLTFGLPEEPKSKPFPERSAPVSDETRKRIDRGRVEVPRAGLLAMANPNFAPEPGVSVEIHFTARSAQLANEVSGTYTVSDNGTISFPYVGRLVVQGSSWPEVAMQLRESIHHLAIGLDDAEIEITTVNKVIVASTGGARGIRVFPKTPHERIDAPGPGYRQQATDAIIWIRSVQ